MQTLLLESVQFGAQLWIQNQKPRVCMNILSVRKENSICTWIDSIGVGRVVWSHNSHISDHHIAAHTGQMI
jgi:hypothetical protein